MTVVPCTLGKVCNWDTVDDWDCQKHMDIYSLMDFR